MLRFKRIWCRLWHRRIMFAGGATYQCCSCQLLWPNPAHKESKPMQDKAERVSPTVKEAYGAAE